MDEEYVHHVDREDRVIGRIARSEAHRRGLLHRAGCVVVRNRRGDVFVARRSRTKSIFASHWDLACSFHVSWGETYAEAAERELLEETGLRGTLQEIGGFVVDEDPDHLVVRVYVLEHEGPLQLDPIEFEWGAFMTPTDVEDKLAEGPATSWFGPAWAIYTRETVGNRADR